MKRCAYKKSRIKKNRCGQSAAFQIEVENEKINLCAYHTDKFGIMELEDFKLKIFKGGNYIFVK